MKFSLLAVLPLAGFFGQAVASPVAAPETLEKRQDVDITVTLKGLFAEIQVHTGNINATVDGLEDVAPSLLGTAMATRIIGQELTAIIGLVNNATDGFLTSKTPSVKGANVVRRQANTQAVAAIIGLILSEISGSLTSIKNGLGIAPFLALLNPLGTSLSNLVLSLDKVVDQLLDLVKELLDGILKGLAGALGGINLGL